MRIKSVLLMLATALALAACSKPSVTDEYVEVAANETAFLIKLDGDTKSNQGSLNSVEYLEHNKVAVKRVFIPHMLMNTCPSSATACYKEFPTARLVKISRTPVTREWTSKPGTGTTSKTESFHVESNESIDFTIGATLTAHVEEQDTAKFLYYYAGVQLAEVLDTNLRSYISSELSKQFGSRSVDGARTSKNEIFAAVFDAAKKEFAKRGITLDNFGFTEGMTFTDSLIQTAINKKFEADMLKNTAQSQLEAAQKFSQAKDAITAMQDLEFRKKLTDAQAAMMLKWDGKTMPQVIGGDSMFTAMFASKVVGSGK